MGICGSHNLTQEQINQKKISQDIQNQILKDHKSSASSIKLLLLGAGESGKSTIFKQMKILYRQGFSETERYEYRVFIHSNVIEAMRALCRACDSLHLSHLVEAKEEKSYFVEMSDNFCFGATVQLNAELGEKIEKLWNDPGIQATWARRSEFQVPDSSEVYFNQIKIISSFDYLPSTEDVLRARVRTSGIIEEHFDVENAHFVLIDVGGQRNERRKWIRCFDNVDSVIYVVALSEYDQTLFEDETTNRMSEALSIFNDICNKYFLDTPIMLFLNKRDLFEKKIKQKNISEVAEFSDYSGAPNNYEEGIEYFKNKFRNCNSGRTKDIFFHITCATDTGNIQFVFDSCKQILLKQNLADSGFIG